VQVLDAASCLFDSLFKGPVDDIINATGEAHRFNLHSTALSDGNGTLQPTTSQNCMRQGFTWIAEHWQAHCKTLPATFLIIFFVVVRHAQALAT
jgi:hypothetical protein